MTLWFALKYKIDTHFSDWWWCSRVASPKLTGNWHSWGSTGLSTSIELQFDSSSNLSQKPVTSVTIIVFANLFPKLKLISQNSDYDFFINVLFKKYLPFSFYPSGNPPPFVSVLLLLKQSHLKYWKSDKAKHRPNKAGT